MVILEKLGNRIRKIRFETIGYLFLMAVGIFLILFEFKIVFSSFRNRINIYEAENFNEADNYYGNIDVILDCFAIESEYSRDGARHHIQDNMRYYIVALDNYTFIGLETSDYLGDDYDAIVEDTWKYMQGDVDSISSGIRFRGVARKMKHDVKKLYTQWFEEMNISGNAIPYNLSEKSFTGIRALFFTGILLFCMSILLLISEFKRMQNRKNAKFYLIKDGKSNEVQHFWDIKNAVQSLDDSLLKSFEIEIKPSVSGVAYMSVEAYEVECKYSLNYIVKKKDSVKSKRIESTDLRSIIDQFSRLYKDGKAPMA